MKKVLCLCLVFVFCFMAAGYAEEAVAAEDVETLFGKIENENYVNEFLGLGFKLEDWRFCPDEEIEMYNNFSKSVLSEEYVKMMETIDSFYVMMAIAPDGTNINISLKNLGENASMYEILGMENIAKANVDSTASLLKMAGYQDVSVEYVITSVEDQEYDGILARYTVQNIMLSSRAILLIRDRYLVTITITGREEDKVNDAFQKLYHLK